MLLTLPLIYFSQSFHPLYSRDSEMASDKQRWHSSVSGKVEDGALVARWSTEGDRGKG
ncbi:hypothetical protein F2Q69_00034467 [Brassica cretica]|uniref:Uncharacterized protein n=1 Tax=Brassica cretica TaxID=69181 RepID=A0A8S9SGD2_BRACR|nr:hypothetical protein F2Q69_00034467 [Brassica cretica]